MKCFLCNKLFLIVIAKNEKKKALWINIEKPFEIYYPFLYRLSTLLEFHILLQWEISYVFKAAC